MSRTAIAPRIRSTDWLIPAGLLVLSAIPVIAGGVRLAELGVGAEITPQNERFFAMPAPVVVHVVSVMLYSVLGAFQFMPSFRRKHPRWHRISGRILVPFGLAAALSGLWMTLVYPWVNFDGEAVFAARLVVGVAMTAFLGLGLHAILHRNVARHRAFMIRAYALGIGAGTQVFTHLPYFLLPQIQGETGRAVCMVGAWILNAAVAEWIIRRARRGARPSVLGAAGAAG